MAAEPAAAVVDLTDDHGGTLLHSDPQDQHLDLTQDSDDDRPCISEPASEGPELRRLPASFSLRPPRPGQAGLSQQPAAATGRQSSRPGRLLSGRIAHTLSQSILSAGEHRQGSGGVDSVSTDPGMPPPAVSDSTVTTGGFPGMQWAAGTIAPLLRGVVPAVASGGLPAAVPTVLHNVRDELQGALAARLQSALGMPQASSPAVANGAGPAPGTGAAFGAPLASPYDARTALQAAGQALAAAVGPRRLPPSFHGAAGPAALPSTGFEGRAAPAAAAAAVSQAATQQAVRAVMEGLQLVGRGEREAPPGTLLVPLLKHQRLALAWMLKRESGAQPSGGILADDQGLGKTVQAIALIVTNPRGAVHPALDGEGAAAACSQHGSGIKAETPCDQPQQPNGISSAHPAESNGGVSKPIRQGDASASDVTSNTEFIDLNELDDPDDTDQPSTSGQAAAAPSTAMLHALQTSRQAGGAARRASSAGAGPSRAGGTPPAKRLKTQRGIFDAGKGAKLDAGTLVVAPTAVLHQWARELAAKVSPTAGLRVHIYHGKNKVFMPEQLQRYDVILTTYTTMALESPARPEDFKKQGNAAGAPIYLTDSDDEEGAGAQENGKAKKRLRGLGEAGPLFQVRWLRIILDEAQAIKNPRTLAAHAAWSLQAERRWCLSGTPIQNSIDDLYAYLRFLRYEPYTRPRAFRSMIKDPLTQTPRLGYQRLRAILQGVLLRRTKSSRVDGEPVVQLPPREQELVRAEFSGEERALYTQLQERSAASMQQMKQEGSLRANYVNLLTMLLRLRQACNHPGLVGGQHARARPAPAPATAAQVAAARRLPGSTRAALLGAVEAGASQCAACADIPEDPSVATCGHLFCRQCIALEVGLQGGSGPEGEAGFQCPCCGQALTAATIFSAAALREPADGAQQQAGQAAGGGQRGWRSSAKVDQLMELLRAVQQRNNSGRVGKAEQEGSVLATRCKSDARLAARLSALPPPPTNPSLPCSAAAPEKVLVFSQWTAMLDILELALKKDKIHFRRLDGTMTVAARERAMADFSAKPDVMVLLMSLKAASLGLNLVAANHVVLMDLWWNPTVEEQAVDRAHRIGQTRTVSITRITIANSIEDRILQLQDRKRQVIDSALGQDAGGLAGATRLTLADLNFLFGGA